jgi:hypothetical protein
VLHSNHSDSQTAAQRAQRAHHLASITALGSHASCGKHHMLACLRVALNSSVHCCPLRPAPCQLSPLVSQALNNVSPLPPAQAHPQHPPVLLPEVPADCRSRATQTTPAQRTLSPAQRTQHGAPLTPGTVRPQHTPQPGTGPHRSVAWAGS